MPLLEVNELRTHFFLRRGVAKAVDGVSFTLDSGETLGLVGESGSGKSVTALSLVRLIPKGSARVVGGQVLFKGQDLLKKSEADLRRLRGKEIAMILQDPMDALNPVFTCGYQVAEAIRIHRGLHGRSLSQKVIEALRAVRIASPETQRRQYPHRLSGGMRQRVVGAIAMSCQPSLIIADEPTTSLDVTIQAQYLQLLQDLQKESSLGILFITHDFGIVANMCDRVAVMYCGRIVEIGRTADLFDKPSHPYTSALIASVPSVLKKVGRLRTIEGEPPSPYHVPDGCAFAPRCPDKESKCMKEAPPAVDVTKGHLARCWKVGNGKCN